MHCFTNEFLHNTVFFAMYVQALNGLQHTPKIAASYFHNNESQTSFPQNFHQFVVLQTCTYPLSLIVTREVLHNVEVFVQL